MIETKDILAVLSTILDPEMPISIVDLGLVECVRVTQAGRVSISILPTFVGCPALPMIEAGIRERVREIEGVQHVDVQFVYDPAWSVDRITEVGRESLRKHGVTVPETGSQLPTPHRPNSKVELRVSAVRCPFCRSESTRLESPFGPTRCRMIFYCDDCKNSFEHMKRV